MNEQIVNAIDGSIEDVLSTMFFADAMPAEEVAPDVGALLATLDFHGSPSGRFAIRIAPDAAAEATCAFLGLDPEEVGEQQVRDTVGEMANMICGSFVSALENDTIIRLDAPQLGDAETPVPALSENTLYRCFQLETGTMETWLELREA